MGVFNFSSFLFHGILLLKFSFCLIFFLCYVGNYNLIEFYFLLYLFLSSSKFNMGFQVEHFCVNHLINCSLESTEEFICVEFSFTFRDNGMRAALQLLHIVLEVTSTSTWLCW